MDTVRTICSVLSCCKQGTWFEFRFTMAGHYGQRGYRVPKLVPGSSESKMPLFVESRTTPAGGSLLLMPRSTLHALFGGTKNVLEPVNASLPVLMQSQEAYLNLILVEGFHVGALAAH